MGLARKAKLLVVDDEPHALTILTEFLESLGFRPVTAASGRQALEMLEGEHADVQVVLTDLNMPQLDGLGLVEQGRKLRPDVDFLMMTAHGTVETAVKAMKLGAYDYLLKPVEFDDLSLRLEQLFDVRKLRAQNNLLTRENAKLRGRSELGSKNAAMARLLAEAEKVRKTDATILLQGETGVGKEVLARFLHEGSERAKGAFVAVNCSAIPDNLLESECFGHEKGAFTGADRRAEGFFQQANGGTLFLDEIGEMDPKLQAKILRALEERKVRRVGGRADETVDIRLIAATHQDLSARVAEGKFREDLYFRLNVVTLRIPPLRDRKEDIPDLVSKLVERFGAKLNRRVAEIDPEFLAHLQTHSFPGNVRELANLVERALIYAENGKLTAAALPPDLGRNAKTAPAASAANPVSFPPGKGLNEIVAEFERNVLTQALENNSNDVEACAKTLGVSRSTLYSKLSRHGIK